MRLLIYFSIVVFSGCLEVSDNIATPETMPFFDLKGFFEKEAARLSGIRNVTKTTTVNGNEEVMVLDSVDLKSDLEIFSKADINRPAWTDKYEIDSLKNSDGKLSKLIYKTEDPKLKTKRIDIEFEKDEVSKISIYNAVESAISNSKLVLTYNPSRGYSIESFQNVRITGENEFKVRVSFP